MSEVLYFMEHPDSQNIYGLAIDGELIWSEPSILKYRYFFDEAFNEKYVYTNDEMFIFNKNTPDFELEKFIIEKYTKELTKIKK